MGTEGLPMDRIEQLTPEQLELCREDFAGFAPNGTMSRAEVQTLLRSQLEREPTPLELDAVINEMARLSEDQAPVFDVGAAFTFETYVACLFGHPLPKSEAPSDSKLVAGPVFEEYLSHLELDANIQQGDLTLTPTDC